MTLLDTITRLIEASEITRRERKLRKTEVWLEGKLRRAFLAQGKAFLAALPAPVVQEAAGDEAPFPKNWEKVFAKEILAAESRFIGPMEEAIKISFTAGLNNTATMLETGLNFKLDNPRAVEYARVNAAEHVKDIGDSTKKFMRTTITDGIEAGKSYNEIARDITDRFKDFSEGRAKRIAVFETGDAYEQAGLDFAKELEGEGLEMEKSWLTVGDDRVRDEHAANEGEGWIPIDQSFGSGADRAPTDPGCRCSTLYRVKPNTKQIDDDMLTRLAA